MLTFLPLDKIKELEKRKKELSEKLKKLPFDQMILYSTFVHISHKHPGPQRGVVLYDEGYEGEYLA